MAVNLENFFALKPRSINISQPKNLREFINKYPNEELRPHMRKLLENYHNFRPIRGDGNCFYRACAFLYFCNSDLSNFSTLFPEAPIFDVKQLPFIREQNITAPQMLEYIWRVYFKPLAKEPFDAKCEKIEDVFNCSFPLDASLIAYFRSLNHKYLKSQQSKFRAYTENMDKELDKVLTLHTESQGVEIYSLAERLNAKITIMMTHEQTLKQVKYNEGGKHHFILFYRPGHYDILMPLRVKLGQLSTPVEQISQMYRTLPYEAPPPRIKKQEKPEARRDYCREDQQIIKSSLNPSRFTNEERSDLQKFDEYHAKRQREVESKRLKRFEMSEDTPKKRLEESKRDKSSSRSRISEKPTVKKQVEQLNEVYVRAPRETVKFTRGPSLRQYAVIKDVAIAVSVLLVLVIWIIKKW